MRQAADINPIDPQSHIIVAKPIGCPRRTYMETMHSSEQLAGVLARSSLQFPSNAAYKGAHSAFALHLATAPVQGGGPSGGVGGTTGGWPWPPATKKSSSANNMLFTIRSKQATRDILRHMIHIRLITVQKVLHIRACVQQPIRFVWMHLAPFDHRIRS